ncbi:hypothetical protein SSS_05036, partial [Sarcoptes scabiei]
NSFVFFSVSFGDRNFFFLCSLDQQLFSYFSSFFWFHIFPSICFSFFFFGSETKRRMNKMVLKILSVKTTTTTTTIPISLVPPSSIRNGEEKSFAMPSKSIRSIEMNVIGSVNDEIVVANTNRTASIEQPPNNVSALSMTPDVNHALTIDHQNSVINLGQSLSLGITNAIVRPLTFFNNLIGSAAGSLPGLFAANGAALGTAIATPIQFGTMAANAAISGITGTLVSIPISLASGGAAQLVGLIGSGRQLWYSTLGSNPSTSSFWQNGELWLQPLALMTGANSILAGVSLNALSQGVKNLGLGIERFGISISNTGKSTKRLGSVLVGWANGRPIYAPVVNDTAHNIINIDLSDVGTFEVINKTFTNLPPSSENVLGIISKDLNEINTEQSTISDGINNNTTILDAIANDKTSTTIKPSSTIVASATKVDESNESKQNDS